MFEYGADLNLKTKVQNDEQKTMTPLVIAAARGNEKSVKKLMRLGASLSA